MKKKLKLPIRLILLFILILQTTIAYSQNSIIKPYSIYFDSQRIAINDPNLHFQYKDVKKGLKLSVRYKDAQLKTMIYKEELYLADSIEIRLSSFAKKKDVNIIEVEGYIVGKLNPVICLRCGDFFYYSTVILYKSKE